MFERVGRAVGWLIDIFVCPFPWCPCIRVRDFDDQPPSLESGRPTKPTANPALQPEASSTSPDVKPLSETAGPIVVLNDEAPGPSPALRGNAEEPQTQSVHDGELEVTTDLENEFEVIRGVWKLSDSGEHILDQDQPACSSSASAEAQGQSDKKWEEIPQVTSEPGTDQPNSPAIPPITPIPGSQSLLQSPSRIHSLRHTNSPSLRLVIDPLSLIPQEPVPIYSEILYDSPAEMEPREWPADDMYTLPPGSSDLFE